jgi:uncharacterized protein YgiM (DUF1202 family)
LKKKTEDTEAEPERKKSSKNEPSTEANEPAGDKASVLQAVSADAIKIRRGPNTEYRSVAEVPRGSQLKIIGKKNGWYKVSANGKTGFVYAGLIDYKKSDAYTTATVTKSKTVSDDNHHDVYKTRQGDRLVVLGGVKNDKYKVQLANGKTGYVDKDAVDVSVDTPQLVP